MLRLQGAGLAGGCVVRKVASIAAVVLAGALAGMAEPAADERAKETSWRLTGARVVRAARTIDAGEGRLWSGYVLEADAVPATGGERAAFRATLSAWSPGRNTPGHVAGRWYLRGRWSLRPSDARREGAPAARVLRGELRAELDFDPRAQPGRLMAQVRAATGGLDGLLNTNEKLEGTLTLSPRRAPR